MARKSRTKGACLRWRNQILLSLGLVLTAALVWGLVSRLPMAEGAAPAPGTRPAAAAVRVLVAPVTLSEAAGRVSAIGDGRALHSVPVTPLVSGRLTDITVAPGARVAAGDVIARLDDEAEAIALARAELAASDAAATLERTERLQAQSAATDVALREARLAARTAELEERDARLAFDRRTVTAPIGGVIGLLPVDPGTQVTPETELAIIDDRSSILVDFRIPERFVGRLQPGDPVEATALARPGTPFHGRITALDNRVETASRTLKLQASLDNADDALRGGMAFSIDLAFRGESHPAVDPLAIQWGGDGAFVWAVRDGKAARVPVRIVERNSDAVLVAADLTPGEQVVTEGIQRLRPGSPLQIDGAP